MITATARDSSRVHYREFHNIFLYITEKCQLRCGHCYMGDRLERGLAIPHERAREIITYCRRIGAQYITLLGGEPTLHPEFRSLVEYAVSAGYRQVMVDTNGLAPGKFEGIASSSLHYISVSLDGATPNTHDRIRGNGTFEKTVSGIRQLVNMGFRIRINCTIVNFNVHEAPAMLALADAMGVDLLNFHTFSEEGYGIGNSDWSLGPERWIEFYSSLDSIKSNYRTSIWYPPTWATLEGMSKFVSEGFRGCLGCSLDRLSIFPDGRCYVCSVLFDEAVHFATLTSDGLVLNRDRNEFDLFSKAAFDASEPAHSGCPAEEQVLLKNGGKPVAAGLVSVCRCWKSQV